MGVNEVSLLIVQLVVFLTFMVNFFDTMQLFYLAADFMYIFFKIATIRPEDHLFATCDFEGGYRVGRTCGYHIPKGVSRGIFGHPLMEK